MEIQHNIIKMIEQVKYIPVPVSETANLYTDLGFDSLAFVSFLIEIEKAYCITFDIAEMGLCTQVDRLAALVESKVKARDGHD